MCVCVCVCVYLCMLLWPAHSDRYGYIIVLYIIPPQTNPGAFCDKNVKRAYVHYCTCAQQGHTATVNLEIVIVKYFCSWWQFFSTRNIVIRKFDSMNITKSTVYLETLSAHNMQVCTVEPPIKDAPFYGHNAKKKALHIKDKKSCPKLYF